MAGLLCASAECVFKINPVVPLAVDVRLVVEPCDAQLAPKPGTILETEFVVPTCPMSALSGREGRGFLNKGYAASAATIYCLVSRRRNIPKVTRFRIEDFP
jgi:hypothetical protein